MAMSKQKTKRCSEMKDPKYFVVQAYRHLLVEWELRAEMALIYDPEHGWCGIA